MVNHTERQIKAIEYYPNGLVKRVEFFNSSPTKPIVYTLTKTVDGKTTVVRKNVSLKQILRPLP